MCQGDSGMPSVADQPPQTYLRNVLPQGLEKSDTCVRCTGSYWSRSPKQLYLWLLRRYDPDTPPESIIVRSAWYGKMAGGEQHEFIVAQLEDIDVEGLINYLVLDRTSSKTYRGYLSKFLPASLHNIEADDAFTISYDGDIRKLLDECQLTPHRFLEELTFDTDNPLHLYDLATLADVVSSQHPYYHALDSSCYLFAGVIWECLRLMRPSADYKDTLRRKRGKRGWYRYTPSDSVIHDAFKDTQNRLPEIQDDLWKRRTETMLNGILPAQWAYYKQGETRVGCTNNTRIRLLHEIHSWTRDIHSKKIYWINGIAGTGKTAIAYSLCKQLEHEDRLGASFFCSRNSPDCRDVNQILPTIAFQLAHYFDPYREELHGVLRVEHNLARQKIEAQFKKLLIEPLKKVRNLMARDLVVAIDALDECTDSNGKQLVLGLLFRYAKKLPLKFVITSRPELKILNDITSYGRGHCNILDLHKVNPTLVQADIKAYLAESLASAQPSHQQIELLSARTGGIFALAATISSFILSVRVDDNRQARLITVLEATSDLSKQEDERMDRLYQLILSQGLEIGQDKGDTNLRQLILWTLVCVREPITISTLAEILSISDGCISLEIEPLKSVLHVSRHTRVVSISQPGFLSFITSSGRAGRFYCNELHHTKHLIAWCFDVMARQLRFNICNLETSYVLDCEVPKFRQRVGQAIPDLSGLLYACKHWGKHLSSTPSERHLPLLERFLQYHLLFWMEVMNLRELISVAEEVLTQTSSWLITTQGSSELQQLLYDAQKFVTAFAASPACFSTPHIYVSMLPFLPKQSNIWTSYWPQTRGPLELGGTAMATRTGASLMTWSVGSAVHDIAPLANGKSIAVGLSDGTLSIWDVSTRSPVVGPLLDKQTSILAIALSPSCSRIASVGINCNISIWDTYSGKLLVDTCNGHVAPISSISFSPDGAFLASGSEDCTIRIWNSYAGTPQGEPFKGHGSYVTSVVFSPDGKSLASGSYDATLRVWDLQGATVAGPFKGHMDRVYSIRFSPDGLRLASGSRDCTIRIWDMREHVILLDPLRGHSRDVLSVAFSPNGLRLVSGSWDHTICIWDSLNGTLIAGPIDAHCGSINSVCFTADEKRIISGSDDGTFSIWDASPEASKHDKPFTPTIITRSITFSPDCRFVALGSSDGRIHIRNTRSGELISEPLRAHAEEILSVAFSHDGARIVSASFDRTLRVWDVNTSTLIGRPLFGHEGWVRSAIFSPAATYIASCSDDCTIRLWSADSTRPVSKRLEGHTATVATIAFSPDGSRIVSGSADFTVRMWNINGEFTSSWSMKHHTCAVSCVDFSPNGIQVVSGSNDMTIIVSDSRNGSILCGPFIGHTHWIRSVMFSPDNSRITSSSLDGTIRVWDIFAGNVVVGPLIGHTGRIKRASFSPDGTCILSGSEDGVIRSWNLEWASNPQTEEFSQFTINQDGWVTDHDSKVLLWVPPDMRSILPTPSSPHVICPTGTVCGNYRSLRLGERWQEIYPQNQVNRSRYRGYSREEARRKIAAVLPRAHTFVGIYAVIGTFRTLHLRSPLSSLRHQVPPSRDMSTPPDPPPTGPMPVELAVT